MYSIGNIKEVFPVLNVSIGQNYFTRPNLLSILSERIKKGTREEKKKHFYQNVKIGYANTFSLSLKLKYMGNALPVFLDYFLKYIFLRGCCCPTL